MIRQPRSFIRTAAVLAAVSTTAFAAPSPGAAKPLPPSHPAASAHAKDASAETSLPASVSTIATGALKDSGVPSVSIAVVRDGQILDLQALGHARLHPDAKATPQMRYSIGSISKQFTASAILLLAEQGKLSLDDHLNKYLPDLAHGDQITIREVLSQVSGYPDYWPQDYVPPEMLQPISSDAILARWTKTLDFTPGQKWEYSNTNYVIAGRIVEKVAGEPLLTFLQQHVFGPLGMKSVSNVDDGPLGGGDAAGYRRFGLGPLRPAPKEGKGWLYAMGELAMTAEDLAKWDVSVMQRTVLKPASYDALERPFVLNDGEGTHYGLGIGVSTVDDRKELRHDGEVSGYTALNVVYPDQKVAIVVLSNEDASDPTLEEIASKIADRLFDTDTAARTAVAKRIYEGLQRGHIDPALFTANARSYFDKQALADFRSSLGKLGAPKSFTQTAKRTRGGFIFRSFKVSYPKQTLKIISYERPDGTFEQFQILPD